MIQKETNLVVADNSGARSVRAFNLYGGSKRKSSSIGDVILAAVKDAIPNGKVKKGDVVRINGMKYKCRGGYDEQFFTRFSMITANRIEISPEEGKPMPTSMNIELIQLIEK